MTEEEGSGSWTGVPTHLAEGVHGHLDVRKVNGFLISCHADLDGVVCGPAERAQGENEVVDDRRDGKGCLSRPFHSIFTGESGSMRLTALVYAHDAAFI